MRKANVMKLKLTIRLLLLVGLLSGFAPVAQAFYNPSAGRWISRDPIEEKGGVNVYGFGKNNAINGIDKLGLRWTDEDEWRFHRPEGCCYHKGKILANKEVDTGVVQYRWEENPGGAGKYHVWLEWDGSVLDSNGDSWYGTGSQKVSFPQSMLPPGGVTRKITLNECKYDLEKFKSCLAAKGAADTGKHGGMCDAYARGAIQTCMEKSKR
jgi:uncharacterized protein RhaS with RHS repeats